MFIILDELNSTLEYALISFSTYYAASEHCLMKMPLRPVKRIRLSPYLGLLNKRQKDERALCDGAVWGPFYQSWVQGSTVTVLHAIR